MRIDQPRTLIEKLNILSDAAKYDVACTSSGTDRGGSGQGMGNCIAAGICHSFSADGRCISLLKILMTNDCVFDCHYCVNRVSNDVERATFTPDEICTLTMEFYRRNYIEGLFLSSGVLRTPEYTMELLYETLSQLRIRHRFEGYIHVKVIPGAPPDLVERIGFLADRVSVNLELPTSESLRLLAPHKTRKRILTPMRQVQDTRAQNQHELVQYRSAPRFVPAGQSTQMIIGATPENDFQIISVAESLYQRFALKRVFYSAFVQVNEDPLLPVLPGGRRFCGSIVCIRQTGCYVFTDFLPQSCSMSVTRILMYFLTRNVTGRLRIWSSFRWRYPVQTMRCFFGCRASGRKAHSGS